MRPRERNRETAPYTFWEAKFPPTQLDTEYQVTVTLDREGLYSVNCLVETAATSPTDSPAHNGTYVRPVRCHEPHIMPVMGGTNVWVRSCWDARSKGREQPLNTESPEIASRLPNTTGRRGFRFRLVVGYGR